MTPDNTALQWYLVQLRPNCAALAERNLARQGFVTFLPLEHITQRRSHQLVAKTQPYFPGYLFVGVNADAAPWHAIRSTQGVARLVSFGAAPALVPPALISELQEACDAEGCIAIDTPLAEGDDVRIAAGPFTDFIGQVERLASDRRAWVLLDLMGKATRISISSGDLRLAS